MKRKTVTIVPACVQQNNHLALLRAFMLTHKATCDSIMHIYLNEVFTDQHEAFAVMATKEAKSLGYFCHRWEDDFDLSKIYQRGKDETDSDYIFYALQDTVVTGDWLTPLQILLDTGLYHSAQGLSTQCNKYNTGEDAPTDVYAHEPMFGGHYLMRRDNGFDWPVDDVSTFYTHHWYCYWLKHHGLKAVLCKDSHINHLEGDICNTKEMSSVDWNKIEPRERELMGQQEWSEKGND